MPVSADTLQLLIDAGLDGDDLMRVVRSIQADNPVKTRSANAERQARFRERKRIEEATSVTDNVISNVTNNVTCDVTPRARVETNLKPDIQTGQDKKKTTREGQAEFEAELSSILDPERVEALVDVRKKRGGKLNAHSARLLIAKIRDCGLTASEAADTMALRNWISIEPEWLNNRASAAHRAGTGQPQEPRTVSELAIHRLETGRSRDEPTGYANGR